MYTALMMANHVSIFCPGFIVAEKLKATEIVLVEGPPNIQAC